MIGADGTVLKDAATGKVRYVPVVTFTTKAIRNKWSDAVIAALRQQYPDFLPAAQDHAAAVDADLQRRPWP